MIIQAADIMMPIIKGSSLRDCSFVTVTLIFM